ncbi:homing endonuclease associated repeat-containing protein [Enterococcus pallens]|uniref:Uncharacterized protein n=1 Tax=Enterococcus pallens ATCC BAA-351 TaxID=1158607 RepID=R2SFX9_9ENTE|nr:AP2 domain-containing protein [Enterococcus pallens]EOH94255.1 hypothetical protein UAU_01990 [Enterococcus pallens ATCC BAA-351]EOU24134.1 hypothetical protein I588_00121 [Enterococcus pallens ATCC BAA-351]
MGKDKITKEYLINKLHSFVEEHGRVPSSSEFPHRFSVKKQFGSFNDFLISQGFTPTRPISKEVLAQKLEAFIEENNRVPTLREFKNQDAVTRLFGTFKAFLHAYGYKPVEHRELKLLGKRFGRLVVVSKGPYSEKNSQTQWNCQCDCGNIKENVLGTNLVKGYVKSCGCLNRENQQLRKYWVDDTNLKVLNDKPTKLNTTGARGVSYQKKGKLYIATIGFRGKSIYLGSYKTFEEAAAARKAAEKEYYAPILEKYKDRLPE